MIPGKAIQIINGQPSPLVFEARDWNCDTQNLAFIFYLRW